MRWNYRFQNIQEFQPVFNPVTKSPSNAPRILNQTMFDSGNNGGCQSACLFEDIERKFKAVIPYSTMREWYFAMDKFWNGSGEKIKRCLTYAQDFGVPVQLPDGRRGRVIVTNLQRIDANKTSFSAVRDARIQNDFCHIAIGRKGSAFFSSMTGNLFDDYAIPQIHAMSVQLKDDTTLLFQNHWGKDWGKDGFGVVTRGKFGTMKVWECFLGDLTFIENK